MAKQKTEITYERATILCRAAVITGGSRATADLLKVNYATVRRWAKMNGPIPESVILWAKKVIRDDYEAVKEYIDSESADK